MKTFLKKFGGFFGLASALTILALATAFPIRSQPEANASIRVQNNSSREFRHVYLAPPGTDNWSEDQLNGSSLRPSGSFTINNVSCVNGQIDVILEDLDGCFSTIRVTCGPDAECNINNATSRDCGS